MSQRTNLKKAFKVARVVMAYVMSSRQTKRIMQTRLPQRQVKWVVRQVHLEIHEPWRVPEEARKHATR